VSLTLADFPCTLYQMVRSRPATKLLFLCMLAI